MVYQKTQHAIFLERPNRFEALVLVDGHEEIVHVKNTGRCREILLPNTEVILEDAYHPGRKTRYDLIAAYKQGFGLINIDSQAPNKVAREYLEQQGYDVIRSEYVYGDSRIDFYMEKAGEKYLMEVKGCTLEIDGIGYFPDAPTQRGIKHLQELQKALADGYHAILCFIIGMDGIYEVRPNMDTHPAFGEALEAAKEAGVEIVFVPCHIEEDSFCVCQGLGAVEEVR